MSDNEPQIILEEVFSQSSSNNSEHIEVELSNNLINYNTKEIENCNLDIPCEDHINDHCESICDNLHNIDNSEIYLNNSNINCVPTILDSNLIIVNLNGDLEIKLKKIFKLLQYVNIILIQSCNSNKDKYFRKFAKIKLTNLFALISENYAPIYQYIVSKNIDDCNLFEYTDLIDYTIHSITDLFPRDLVIVF